MVNMSFSLGVECPTLCREARDVPLHDSPKNTAFQTSGTGLTVQHRRAGESLTEISVANAPADRYRSGRRYT
jgi:hypothetical protein